jgi:hypothetical protein
MTLLHVAVVMTCHERVSRTLACLRSLHDQTVLDAIHLTVSLVDADSTDGTADAVASAFPAVRVLRRSSDLFWNSGMREALADAHEHDPAHYLWLNDDVELDADALERLLASDLRARRQGRPPRVTVASTRDPTTGALTYGGVVRRARLAGSARRGAGRDDERQLRARAPRGLRARREPGSGLHPRHGRLRLRPPSRAGWGRGLARSRHVRHVRPQPQTTPSSIVGRASRPDDGRDDGFAPL